MIISCIDFRSGTVSLRDFISKKSQDFIPFLFILDRLLEEVDSVIGDKEDIRYDDIIKMEYMMLVMS